MLLVPTLGEKEGKMIAGGCQGRYVFLHVNYCATSAAITTGAISLSTNLLLVKF